MNRYRIGARLSAAVLSSFAIGFSGAPLYAQDSGQAVGFGAFAEMLTFGDASATGLESLTLITLPFAAGFQLADGVNFNVNGAVARGSMSLEGGRTESLTGLTDTSLRLSWMPTGDAVVVSVAALLPTGNTELTQAEAVVAGTVGSDLLPFRISSWGAGGGFDGSVSLAGSSGRTGYGVRAGYTYQGEFSPLASSPGRAAFNYDPGEQIYVRAALDQRLQSGGTLNLSLTLQSFGEDAANGEDFFASGTRIQGLGSYVFPSIRRGTGHVYGGFLRRSEGQYRLSPGSTAAQTVLFAGTGLQYRSGSLILRPTLDLRVLRTGDGVGQGWVSSAGVGLVRQSGSVTWTPNARVRLGSLTVGAGVESSILGFEVGMGLQFGRAR